MKLMKRIILITALIIPVLLCGITAYVYFAVPLVWPVLRSDIVNFDLRGKMYHFSKLGPLKKQAAVLEKQGKKNIAANQIIHETHWLCHSTRDFDRIDRRLSDLRSVLSDPSFIGQNDEQSDKDGSWGKWYTEWFFKLDASYEQIKILSEKDLLPKYPIHFFDKINSPDEITNHLRRLSVSDIDKYGVDNSRELNETISALIRMVTRNQPANYPYHPRLKRALTDFILNELVDPDTGYLAYRYKTGNDVKKRISLSMTFHVVQYLDRKVINWQKLISTTLAMKDREFNNGGWLDNGKYVNHHNMDVVELFRLSWPYVTPDLQDAMKTEMRKMLNWCLKESLQPDGSFKKTAFENDSVEEYTYFGASFLSRVGYFDKQKRFWTDEEFPEAQIRKERIIQFINHHINAGGAGGTYYRNALKQLGERSINGEENAKTL